MWKSDIARSKPTKAILLFIVAVPVILLMAACGADEIDTTGLPGEMEITSPAFGEGGAIPSRYSCEGEDISPELTWEKAPGGTESFVLIADDPDAPGGDIYPLDCLQHPAYYKPSG